MLPVRSSRLDRLLRPLHRWVWRDERRRASKLFRFAQTESDGGRDLSRAAELTADGLLRRLFLRHALDEQRHAALFAERGRALLAAASNAAPVRFEGNWLAPGERGLDDLRVEQQSPESLLAFLHLSEKAAAGRFQIYQEVLAADPQTRAVFREVLQDEAFHMTYTDKQLGRIAPRRRGWLLWQARLGRLWKAYLRLAVAVAGAIGTAALLVQYFVFLPPFAFLAKRSQRRELPGWAPVPTSSGRGQYR